MSRTTAHAAACSRWRCVTAPFVEQGCTCAIRVTTFSPSGRAIVGRRRGWQGAFWVTSYDADTRPIN